MELRFMSMKTWSDYLVSNADVILPDGQGNYVVAVRLMCPILEINFIVFSTQDATASSGSCPLHLLRCDLLSSFAKASHITCICPDYQLQASQLSFLTLFVPHRWQ